VTIAREGIYVGAVMHRRLRPHVHHFRYAVFNVFADVDRLAELATRVRFLSHNRFNLFSLYDRDFGDGGDLRAHLDGIAAASVGSGVVQRFMMLCYPRVLGYVFNPLTVYYGLDRDGQTALCVYEVSNTFGERHTYAIAADPDARGVMRHSCDKAFYVSPFNHVKGRYAFRTMLPGRSAAIGIRLDDNGGPLLAAHFAGIYQPLTDRTLLQQFTVKAFLTHKVWLGIRWEALRLWLRGLPIHRKPAPPEAPVSVTGRTVRSDPEDLAA